MIIKTTRAMHLFLLASTVLWTMQVRGQEKDAVNILPDPNPVLQSYISEALQSNEGLRQVKLDYDMHLAALKEARGLFFPDISLNARYTVADGGRMIEFPVGDLLNPVYSTLNMLTASNSFPQIENETFPFYRPTEQETKLSLVQPIFQSQLIHQYRIREQSSEIARIGVDRYRRELVREVSKAYYEYQKAEQLVALADTSLALVEENLRVSRSLFENDKVTIDAVYRSEAEISKVQVQQARTRNMLEASRAYFNFLLNRDLGEAILPYDLQPTAFAMDADQAGEMALQNREELKELAAYQLLNERQTDFYRGSNVPGLFGVVDYGFQGEEYRFGPDDDFVMASLVMQWTLFQGRVNHQKVQQSRIEGDKLESLLDETQMQIQLEVINHTYALEAAFTSVQAARTQMQSASKAYLLIERKYQEGQSSLLELIDARTSLTSAAANAIVTRSEYFSSLADFSYAVGVQHYHEP